MDVNLPQAFPTSTTKGYTCSFCASYFQFLDELNNHINAIHKIIPFPPTPNNPILSEQGKFKCSVCSKAFHDVVFLKMHLKSSHRMEVTTNPLPKPAIPLSVYARKSKNILQKTKAATDLSISSEPHKSNYKCDGCERSFSKRYRMKEHAVMHSEPSIPCQFCGYMFKEKRSLVKHAAREANCKRCDNSFNCPGLFKKHQCNFGTQVQNQSEKKQIGDNVNVGDAQTLQPQKASSDEMLLDNSDIINDADDSTETTEMEDGDLDKATERETTQKVTKEFALNQMLRYFQEIDDILANMNKIINA